MKLLKNSNTVALLSGALCVFGFAPFGIYLIPVVALAVLFILLLRAETPSKAARIGFSFGLGLFGSGISWIYVALHDYGAMPLWLAAPAALLFAAFLALFPALAAYLQARFFAARGIRLLALMPASWVLVEWLRGMIFTGFPWLTLGYAHTESPLAGYAPVLGVYGVSWLATLSAGLLAGMVADVKAVGLKANLKSLAFIIVIWGGGALLHTVTWTQPLGAPISVALIQGNITQDEKFNEDALVGTLETYRRLILQSEARLTVLPETALPLLRHQVPPAWEQQLREHAQHNNGDILIGAFERDAGLYFNSVFSAGSAPEQHYRKQHLVPFGEFIPLRPVLGWFINGVLDIPMGDLTRGDAQANLLNVAGQQIAVNICYEDVFGEEIIRALPQASLLVNVTNDAWYGHSHAAAQHNQIAQLRALETGRMLLRATNTGVTSIINADGTIQAQLPQHQQATLRGNAQAYQGSTPYVRWGNGAILIILLTLLAGFAARGILANNKRDK